MADFRIFIRNMRRRANQVEEGVEKVVKAAALEVDAAVVQATPVDTGRARSNWIVRLNSPATGEVGEGSIDRGGQSAITQGISAIGGYSIRRDRSINISNNVSYIGDLNNGSSAQAPANFVGQAVQNGATAVRSSRLFQ